MIWSCQQRSASHCRGPKHAPVPPPFDAKPKTIGDHGRRTRRAMRRDGRQEAPRQLNALYSIHRGRQPSRSSRRHPIAKPAKGCQSTIGIRRRRADAGGIERLAGRLIAGRTNDRNSQIGARAKFAPPVAKTPFRPAARRPPGTPSRIAASTAPASPAITEIRT
jgi:hypothetical protein